MHDPDPSSSSSAPPRPGWPRWARTLERLRLFPGPDATAVAIAIGVGVLAGLGNLGFRAFLEGSHWLFWEVVGEGFLGARLGDPDSNFFLVPLVPILGMAVIALLDRLFPGEIKGYGLPRFLELVNLRGGYLKRRWILLKMLATSVTIGSGMSAGIEGPAVQIGGSIGSTVSRTLRSSAAQLKVLIACGSAGAISSAFGAPITGVIFAQEIILLGEYQLRTFGLIVISAASATVFNHWLKVTETVLVVPDYHWTYGRELLLYLVLGVLLGLVAVAFIRVIYGARDVFERWEVPGWTKPLVGGLAVGLLVVVFPGASGNGYDTLNGLHQSEFWLGGMLVALAFVKILATGITLGAGGAGGVFAPALVVGGTFGAGFAQLVNRFLPDTIAASGSFALVGMGAMLGAATHAPLTAVFLLLELTHDYDVVLPIMFATVTAVLVARALEPESVDTLELARRGIHLHQGHEASVLRGLHVGAFFERSFQPVPLSMPLSDFLHYLPQSRWTYFPVVDEAGRLAGVITTQDVREILFERDVWPLLVVGDVANTGALETVTPRDTLHEALHRFGRQGLERLLVVDADDPAKVLGFLSRQAILDAYQKAIMARELEGQG